jgi:VWFA-related protein
MKKSTRYLTVITIVFLVFLYSYPPARGQQPELKYEVEVTVTQVDVVVTDSKGERVTGLKPENFKIYEDGVLQELTNFFEVKGMEVYASVAEKEGAPLKVPEKPLPEAVAPVLNKIIIYFDNWHLHPLNRNWSIKKLEQFVKNNFPPGSSNQGMIVALDRSITVLQKFTNSQSLLLEGLKAAKKRAGESLQRAKRKEDLKKELNRMIDETNPYDKYGKYESALDQARNYAMVEQNELRFSLKSLNAFIDYLTGLQGRKVLIYVSDGLPISPGDDVFAYINQAFPLGNAGTEAMNFDATRLFKDLTSRCNANEITLYPVNARGLESKVISADQDSGWGARHRGAGVIAATSRVKNDAFNLMARDTGGLAILNTNNIDAGLTRIKNDLNYYYSLGYRSLYRGDNRFHSIKVKLTGLDKKYNVRVRSGFKQISPEEKIKASVTSRLFIQRYYNPLGLRLQFLPVKPKAFSDKLRLGIKLFIPIRNLTLNPGRYDHAGEVKVWVILKDEEGSISPIHELTEKIKIPVKDLDIAMKSSYPYEVEMYVNPGKYSISMAIKDIAGDSTPSYIQLNKTITRN